MTTFEKDNQYIMHTYGRFDLCLVSGKGSTLVDENGKEYLIPAIPPVVISTDINEGIIKIRPLKGIFEDEN